MDTGLISEQDVTVLLRLVITLESNLLSGTIAGELCGDLDRQFQNAELLGEPSAANQPVDLEDVAAARLRLALANLNQRLRYALGDYDTLPVPDPGWTDQYFGFPSAAAADRFLAEARTAGERGLEPVAGTVDATSTRMPFWRVVVTIRELELTAAFSEHVRRLSILAAQHGGSHQGSGAPGSTNAV